MNDKLKKGIILGGVISVILNIVFICAIITISNRASDSRRLVEQLQKQLTSLNGEITTSINISGSIEQGNSQLGTTIDTSKAIIDQISAKNRKLGELIEASRGITTELRIDNSGLTKSIDSGWNNCRTAEERNREAQRLITECVDILKQSGTDNK